MPDAEPASSHKLLRHAPAGRPVPGDALNEYGKNGLRSAWSDVDAELFQSGTAALAIAIQRALADLGAGSRGRVALPAYGCPNLVAAALWAGGTPIYYDLSRSTMRAETQTLQELLSADDTVLVHVDAFGAVAADSAVDELARRGRVIVDLAQSFAPYLADWQPQARYNVISMGRAKPMSLTFGGGLISPVDARSAATPVVGESDYAKLSVSTFLLRAAVYAFSLRPTVFGALSRIPQLGIGQTKFAPLTEAQRLPDAWHGPVRAGAAQVRRDIARYLQDSDAMLELAQESGVTVLPGANRISGRLPLWRVPVLCPTADSARSLCLHAGHLGVSGLYGRTIPELMGMPRDQVAARWPNALWIAERLVTLPTHGRLRRSDLSSLRQALQQNAAGSEAVVADRDLLRP